ncbi:hypothetical protein [Sphingomonas sp. PP-CC-3A-396]|jgi:uncharacterized protein YjbJ (UPF0337 family)|uniref:hypothetical protein n=1 Tax=Sphingomonas sp. PP-CC-3A-396 TaxID=2135655 RepID=UPI0010E820F5|nr:hypothetical protein [Sphingomonas sp. PP-CC-3A-396]TCQ06255.1 hypothetical protein C8J40_10542 [Sphingomonas sp. PP-CC-3A-396]
MTRDTDKGRVRQAKGSVQEAIGKLIGDTTVTQRGASESEAGAREADGADAKAAPPRTKSSPEPKPDSRPTSGRRRTGQKDGAH